MFESFFSVFLDWPHAFFIIFKTELYFSGIITPVYGSMWFPSKKIYSAFLLSSSIGGLLLSWKMENPPHFLLLWNILLVPSVWGEFSKRGALQNSISGGLGSSKYYHKRSLELKVKFDYIEKIKLLLFLCFLEFDICVCS